MGDTELATSNPTNIREGVNQVPLLYLDTAQRPTTVIVTTVPITVTTNHGQQNVHGPSRAHLSEITIESIQILGLYKQG